MKKFIVTINGDWTSLRFEFSKQDDACKFMAEGVKASTTHVKFILEVEEITDEEKNN